ncbi:MAG: response regulator [Candidatus Aureabacteria bacterium]|nr:response regulator [Candidatus Auribacterota bacterium]
MGKKILIIEDEPDFSKVLAKVLFSRGYEVMVAADAYHGIQSAYQYLPDLIILDVMLPAGGGFSVLRNKKLSSKISPIPVLALTAKRDENLRESALGEGADAYM